MGNNRVIQRDCLLGHNCKSCYRSLSHKMVFGSIATRATSNGNIVMFIGDSITISDVKLNSPFNGKSNKLLREVIDLYKLSNWSYLTNVIKCYGNDNNEIYIKKCIYYLIEEIKILKPKLIVTVGSFAYKALTDDNIILKNKINKPIKFANSILIPIYGTAYISKNKLYEEYDKSFKIISDIYSKLNSVYALEIINYE